MLTSKQFFCFRNFFFGCSNIDFIHTHTHICISIVSYSKILRNRFSLVFWAIFFHSINSLCYNYFDTNGMEFNVMQKSKNQEEKTPSTTTTTSIFFFALNHISIRSTSVFLILHIITQHLYVFNIKTLITFNFFSHTDISSKKWIYIVCHIVISHSTTVWLIESKLLLIEINVKILQFLSTMSWITLIYRNSTQLNLMKISTRVVYFDFGETEHYQSLV